MYKTGKEIKLTREFYESTCGCDFLPVGTVRKAKICFKTYGCATMRDAVVANYGTGSLLWYILRTASTDDVANTFLRWNFVRCGSSSLLIQSDDGNNWMYGYTRELLQWLNGCGDFLSVTFTERPVRPDRLSGVKTLFNTDYPDIKNEVGSELELEATTPELSNFMEGPLSKKVKKISKLTLVDNIGRDCSVRGYGPEIRFSHPSLGKWRKDAIERVISAMKEIGFSAGRSAGQHVHVSHPKIKAAIYKSSNDITGMNEFLQPISCRQANPQYGLGNNIMRDQFYDFKTLEIRVWESTTNADLFKKRLRFSNALVKSLIRRGVDYKNIWTKMSKTMGEDYVDMLFIDNPHQVGMSMNEVMSRLPGSLKDYAREKYGWNESQQ